jgi:hypothetical protein
VCYESTKGRFQIGSHEPVIIGNVLHHGAQTDQEGIRRKPRYLIDDVLRREIDPADERSLARKSEQKFGLSYRLRRLKEDCFLNAQHASKGIRSVGMNHEKGGASAGVSHP